MMTKHPPILVLVLALATAVGCRPKPPAATPVCIKLQAQPVGTGPNPTTIQGVTFQVFNYPGGPPVPTTRIRTQGSPPLTGLDAGFRLVITPPVSSKVAATLVHYARPAQMQALSSSNAVLGSAVMTAANGVPQQLTLGAPGIGSVVVTSPSDEVMLLDFCYAK
jgi:hypothetical protein